MNRFFTLLLAASCLTAVGQESCSLVYDGNGDGAVGSADLVGLLTEYGINCNELGFSQCGDPLLFDGHTYTTVAIAGQCWFAENLRSTHYANGDDIPMNISDSLWQSYPAVGRTAVYGDDEGCINSSTEIDACDTLQSFVEYGRLYNWYAATDERGLCPQGWHVPSDEEWMEFEVELGMTEIEAESTGWRGTNQGEQLKSTTGWYLAGWINGNGTDTLSFSALPGGIRYSSGSYGTAGSSGWWWCTNGSFQSARYRRLEYDESRIWRSSTAPFNGLSIRCIKDAE